VEESQTPSTFFAAFLRGVFSGTFDGTLDGTAADGYESIRIKITTRIKLKDSIV